jgi:CO/xanthine dehydrogenase Mo-binding subunit
MTTAISRRGFLQSSAGACLVVGIGFRLPAPSEADGTVFAPGPYLSIDGRGEVTVSGFRAEMGQGIHTAIAMLVAEELDADWRKVRVELTRPDDRLHMGTTGSRSVREHFLPLRKAGAAARHMLIFAASLRFKVPVNGLTVRNGVVLDPASGRRIPFGDLVLDASRVPPPTDPPLKRREQFTLIGKPVPRVDTPAKVDGSARFGVDVRLPGLRYACLVRPPVLGATLVRFADSAARQVAGVSQVIRVEESVAVVASNSWAAMRGAAAIQPVWSESTHAALHTDLIRQQLEAQSRREPLVAQSVGDAASALKRDDLRQVTAEYHVPYLAHATLEPQNCTAVVTADRAEVWVPTQSPRICLDTVVELTGLPADRVTVNPTYLGGGFGRRGKQDFVREAVLVARAAGGPVQTLWTREDDMRHDFYRPATHNRMAAALDSSGKLVAWHHCATGQSILAWLGRPAAGADATSVEGAVHLLYDIPNFQVDYCRLDGPVPVGAWRSVGHSQNVFVVESFIDEVASVAGVDPVAFRLRHIKDPRLRAVVELAAAQAGWGTPLPAGLHRGIACAANYGSFAAEVAEVSVTDGAIRVHRVVAAIDCGQVVNPDTVRAQVEGGIVYGLTAALYGEITYKEGRVVQGNFSDYPLLRLPEMPRIETHIVPSDAAPGGAGEPGTPPIAPAVANAVSAALGRRVRRLPIRVG